MKQAFALMIVLAICLQLGHLTLGFQAVFQILYGAIALMGIMISGTFLWLYAQRATPLALGMAYSWSGASLVLGWWWIYALLGEPQRMDGSPLHFAPLALYLAGAILHFSVINRSFGGHGTRFLWPIFAALTLSSACYVLA